MEPIAIVGMACRFPDAASPRELWESVLAERRAFRAFPPQRLRLADYFSPDREAPDRTYVSRAAVLTDYEFDRAQFRVAGSTYRTTDLTHWLALDVAAQALADAGWAEGKGCPAETTGVVVGNTLTGEFSRAHLMRLRWPYVRRIVEEALSHEAWDTDRRALFLRRVEESYKTPFPPVDGDTLAGGLSNTIAGRVCNFFDFKGGGYTIDGACASSLLSVTMGCSALEAGDLDVVLAGGVDLSLDPFELVGFAKVGALAREEMRVYDARPTGFWPGEGCGFIVLMRHGDAVAQGRRIQALLCGWGVSSDGSGGLTRPEVEGQMLALRRAYRRAGFGIDTVSYFEGHGTGTEVGDATELQALSLALKHAGATSPPVAVIGSVKANIGHTKAAAGIAGLIKAVMAVRSQILPPTTGCQEPASELAGEKPALRILTEGAPWPSDRPLRAGVSATGFGGINTHVVIEAADRARRAELRAEDSVLLRSGQDAELFLLGADNQADLGGRVEWLIERVDALSFGELADLAATLSRTLKPFAIRAAVVASTPAQLHERLGALRSWLREGCRSKADRRAGVFLGSGFEGLRVGLLFPGQGSPVYVGGGALARRFPSVRELYPRSVLPRDGARQCTELAQPAIVTASLAGLRALREVGIEAVAAVGHSLGEIVALHWGGALEAGAVVRIAAARGRAMADLSLRTGAMASIASGPSEVEALLGDHAAVIAAYNSPGQTVVAGDETSVIAVVERARSRGIGALRLPVSHAFHSPLIAGAAPQIAVHLATEAFRSLQGVVASTVTGARLQPLENLPALLLRQITSPVRFTEAVGQLASAVDLWVEVGPGRILSDLVTELLPAPAVTIDAGSCSLKGFLGVIGAAFALGAPVRTAALFDDRFSRPLDLDRNRKFLASPCELAPSRDSSATGDESLAPRPPDDSSGELVGSDVRPLGDRGAVLDVVRSLVATRVELPVRAIRIDQRLLQDLHLNSLTVGELVAEASRRLGLPAPAAPTDYARATVGEIAQALDDLRRTGCARRKSDEDLPPGVASWTRCFTVELVERPRRSEAPSEEPGNPSIIAPPGYVLADRLREALRASGPRPWVFVCLPPDPEETHVGLLIEGARAVESARTGMRLFVVQSGGGGAAFARSFHQENPNIPVSVIDVPPGHPEAVQWIIGEARAASGYSEAHYDTAGRRREPRLRLLPIPERGDPLPLTQKDVLLVTGGGKGITAECALDLAKATGVGVAIVGRSRVEQDVDLARNLGRFGHAGARYRYVVADITDLVALRSAIREIEATLGCVTAILHGAGVNVPQVVSALDEETVRYTLRPKVSGMKNLLECVDKTRLRLVVAFGSVLARTGMAGEAHYGLANEWLRNSVDRFQMAHPSCRSFVVEWSLWEGVGMGVRLGRVDALACAGIASIAPEEGVAMLRRLLVEHIPATSVVVSGRLGKTDLLAVDDRNLPRRRFLETPRVHLPGVELVADASLSLSSDPYLADHVFEGRPLLPAVMGLEAMAQVATALLGRDGALVFDDVRFDHGVWISSGEPVTIRAAGLKTGPDRAQLVLRSAETGFQVNHFQASCHLAAHDVHGRQPTLGGMCTDPLIALDPERDLYGSLLFQGRHFRRIAGFRRLRAMDCVVELRHGEDSDWFTPPLPQDLILGDPGVRDAAIHAIQACIPNASLLPIGVNRLVITGCASPGPLLAQAVERQHLSDLFVYDLELLGSNGLVCERWEGLRLKVVDRVPRASPWPAALLGPYLQRELERLVPGVTLSVVVAASAPGERREDTDALIARALGRGVLVQRRSDGKPELTDGHVSVAHARGLSVVVTSAQLTTCDVEPVSTKAGPAWQDLLGHAGFSLAQLLSGDLDEVPDITATRVWAARECLTKAGARADAVLTLLGRAEKDWTLFETNEFVVATLTTRVLGFEEAVVFGVLTRKAPLREHVAAGVNATCALTSIDT